MQLEKNLKIVVELYKIKYEKKIINKKTVDIKKIFFLLLKIKNLLKKNILILIKIKLRKRNMKNFGLK